MLLHFYERMVSSATATPPLFLRAKSPPKEAVSCLWKVHLLLNEVSCHGHDIELQLVVEKAVARPIGNEATAL